MRGYRLAGIGVRPMTRHEFFSGRKCLRYFRSFRRAPVEAADFACTYAYRRGGIVELAGARGRPDHRVSRDAPAATGGGARLPDLPVERSVAIWPSQQSSPALAQTAPNNASQKSESRVREATDWLAFTGYWESRIRTQFPTFSVAAAWRRVDVGKPLIRDYLRKNRACSPRVRVAVARAVLSPICC
jgi:hypothetical protein